MNINIDKSEIVVVLKKAEDININTDDHAIYGAKNMKYVGSILDRKASIENHIHNRR